MERYKQRLTKIILIGLMIGSLLPQTNRGSKESIVGVKSVDDYWSETDLTTEDLENLLRPPQCQRDFRHFLACANAVSAVAEKMGLVLTENGKIKNPDSQDVGVRLSEREDLKKWTDKFTTEESYASVDFQKIWRDLRSRLSREKALGPYLAAGINGYLSVAEDPHSYIVPLAYYEEVASRAESQSFQLGFVARRIHGGSLVRKVFSNSPAAKAGLKKGDLIVQLNGLEVSRIHPSVYTDLIRGQVGQRLLLQIERMHGDRKETRYLELRRESFKLTSVESRLLPGVRSIGLLTIHKFAFETCQQARTQLADLMAHSIEGLLLDLRDNPGGQVDEAACVLNLFLPQDTFLFETRYLDVQRLGELYVSDRSHLYSGPLAVLINAGSASASEIVAGSLKDHGRAVLVGERSFGKGSFQDGSLWRPRSRIAFFQTQGFYYFPSGWTPQLVGLQPDIPVSVTPFESFREENLYHGPLRPKDLWNGPQTLAWLHQARCAHQGPLLSTLDDPQIEKASEWIHCGESTNRRRGSNDVRN